MQLRSRSSPLGASFLVILAFCLEAGAQGRFNLTMDEMCSPELGDLSLTIDSYGAFGSAVPSAGDAFFDPPPPEWRQAGTVFESMAFLCMTKGGSTTGSWLRVGGDDIFDPFGGGGGAAAALGRADAEQQGSSVVSSFEVDDTLVELVSTLNCNTLTQCYTFTNNGNQVLNTLAITHYIDGDLYFVGGFTNDYGSTIAGPPRVVYEFDQGDNPLSPSTYIGLSSTDPRDPFLTSWELGEYSESRTRISNTGRGCPVLLNGLVDSAHLSTDRNGDLVTDDGYDVTLSLRFDVGPLAPGETTVRPMCLDIRWGVGLPCGDPDEDGICQQD
ncbi:MAG: hypothetical protein FJ125_11105, partial [Deltaproteobacteria bacterium]|nr:hypothetical protein [Deltaproteobacteria bacterium]